MSDKNNNWEREFDARVSRLRDEDWGDKFRTFLRYLSTRKMECWGFFAAGFIIATIF